MSAAARCLAVLAVSVLFAGCGDRGPKSSPAEHSEAAGNEAFVAGEYEQAVAHFQKALETGGGKPRIHNNLANAFYREGRLGAAAASYRKALELDPEYLLATNNLVLALYGGGERDRAWEFLTQAQMNWPRISFFYTTAGYLKHLEGDRDGARKAFREAISLNADSPAALNNLGVLLMEQPVAGEDALPYLMRAIEKDPGNMLFRDSLGWYHFTHGMFADATIEIGKAFYYDPKNLEVRVHYATVLEWVGKETEALEQWTKILELADDERVKAAAHEHYWELQGRGVSASPE